MSIELISKIFDKDCDFNGLAHFKMPVIVTFLIALCVSSNAKIQKIEYRPAKERNCKEVAIRLYGDARKATLIDQWNPHVCRLHGRAFERQTLTLKEAPTLYLWQGDRLLGRSRQNRETPVDVKTVSKHSLKPNLLKQAIPYQVSIERTLDEVSLRVFGDLEHTGPLIDWNPKLSANSKLRKGQMIRLHESPLVFLWQGDKLLEAFRNGGITKELLAKYSSGRSSDLKSHDSLSNEGKKTIQSSNVFDSKKESAVVDSTLPNSSDPIDASLAKGEMAQTEEVSLTSSVEGSASLVPEVSSQKNSESSKIQQFITSPDPMNAEMKVEDMRHMSVEGQGAGIGEKMAGLQPLKDDLLKPQKESLKLNPNGNLSELVKSDTSNLAKSRTVDPEKSAQDATVRDVVDKTANESVIPNNASAIVSPTASPKVSHDALVTTTNNPSGVKVANSSIGTQKILPDTSGIKQANGANEIPIAKSSAQPQPQPQTQTRSIASVSQGEFIETETDLQAEKQAEILRKEAELKRKKYEEQVMMEQAKLEAESRLKAQQKILDDLKAEMLKSGEIEDANSDIEAKSEKQFIKCKTFFDAKDYSKAAKACRESRMTNEMKLSSWLVEIESLKKLAEKEPSFFGQAKTVSKELFSAMDDEGDLESLPLFDFLRTKVK